MSANRGSNFSRFCLLLPVALLLSSTTNVAAEETQDSCVECHRNEAFLVTNKKLYDYFQQWSNSIHKLGNVTCVDCHGGNPNARDKNAAHRGSLKGSNEASAVNFQNIPKMCGECHKDVFRGFRESAHYDHIVARDQEDQGPTCVTCHGSINVSVLNVNTVEATCSKCHNEESKNSPENPAKARGLLDHLLTIHRYYRYIGVRLEPVAAQEYLKQIDQQLHELSITWHTFDLEEIDKKMDEILSSLKKKREEVGKTYKKKTNPSDR